MPGSLSMNGACPMQISRGSWGFQGPALVCWFADERWKNDCSIVLYADDFVYLRPSKLSPLKTHPVSLLSALVISFQPMRDTFLFQEAFAIVFVSTEQRPGSRRIPDPRIPTLFSYYESCQDL